MKRIVSIILTLVISGSILSGCNSSINNSTERQQAIKGKEFKFDVNPETFQIILESEGVKEKVSEELPKMEVANLKKSDMEVSWSLPKENIEASVKKEKDYLDVKIKAKKEGKFTWPKVSGESYVMPMGEGKLIPSDDSKWKQFLNGADYTGSEGLSMQFFAANKEKYSIVYVIENMFNNEINFDTKDKIKFNFSHEFTSINKQKEYGFRIYVEDKNPVNIAGIYKGYVQEKGKFTTLEEKSKSNENIKKLYGAPHVYLWATEFVAEDNIKWQKLIKMPSTKGMGWIKSFLQKNAESGKEAVAELENIKKDGFASQYQKALIVSSLNQVLLSRDFCNTDAFTELDEEAKKLKNKGIDKLNKVELYDLNKRALKSELKDAIDPIEKWGNGNSVDLLKDMNNSGIKNAWLGFDNWATAFINPEFVEYANRNGYLIGAYDSYHSIHEKGNDNWITASFKDSKLYEEATIENKDGKKVGGFLGKGRKLNPTLSMKAVKDRMDDILTTGVKFNSWFIDCDAAGELYDDYSPKHITTQEQDMKARLKRMEYIRDDKKMVVGSEGGDDYASQTIAFAHGIETPVIAWSDKDMRENKDSEYYVGGYWSSKGGVPPRYSKEVPIKALYKSVYIDPTYSVPLFKLVYNDSVITTHHWEWGSLKIKDEVKNRMLYEVLYNVPPLYHLDKKEWADNKNLITSHNNVWSPFHKKAITKEMTDFKVISEDKLVQMTEYGKDLKVVANFSDKDFKYENDVVKAKSLIIYDAGKKINYTP